jgi:hypothetical protein
MSVFRYCFVIVLSLLCQQVYADELLYFFLDISRSSQAKNDDIKILDEIINHTKEHENIKYFFHFTGVPRKPNFFLIGKSDINQKLEGYKTFYLSATYKKFSVKTLPNELSSIKANVMDLKLGENVRKLFIFFSDMDFIDAGSNISSISKGLGDGWLTSSRSPFVKEFLREDNSTLKGSKVVVLNSHSDSVFLRQNRLYFYTKMFNRVKCDLFFLGPSYPTNLIWQYVDATLSGKLEAIVAEPPKQTELLQFFTLKGEEENVSVYP